LPPNRRAERRPDSLSTASRRSSLDELETGERKDSRERGKRTWEREAGRDGAGERDQFATRESLLSAYSPIESSNSRSRKSMTSSLYAVSWASGSCWFSDDESDDNSRETSRRCCMPSDGRAAVAENARIIVVAEAIYMFGRRK